MENRAPECGWVSLGGTARLLDEYGASGVYEDRRGMEDPSLQNLVEADEYPSVRGVRLVPGPGAVRVALRCGDAVACTWPHVGDCRANLSDGTTVRRLSMMRPAGLEGHQDVASGCLVGYDAATDLFFGHAPSVAGDEGLVALSSEFVERRCVDLLCVRLEERHRETDLDVADATTTIGSDSEGSTVDSWMHPVDTPRPEAEQSTDANE
jgi:hypothetical protein